MMSRTWASSLAWAASMVLGSTDILAGGFGGNGKVFINGGFGRRLAQQRKDDHAKGRANHHRNDGHITVEETDIAVGCAREDFDRIRALADLPEDVFLGLGGGD